MRKTGSLGAHRRAAMAVTLALFWPLAGCHGSGGVSSGPQPGGVVLKIASQRGGTRALMEAAGVLGGTPYRVEWSEFPAAQTLLEALGADAIDAGAVGDAPFMFAYASGAKIKAVQAVRADNAGATVAIVVPATSPIRSVEDLKGRRVATGRGSIGHYLLLLALERAHLKPSDVTIIFLAPGDSKAALAAGSVDAWSTWGSYVHEAWLHDSDRIVADNRGLLHDVGFEAATDQAIAGKRPALDDFLHRLAKAERWANNNRGVYAKVLAKDVGLPQDVAEATVQARGNYHAVPIDADVEAAERNALAHFQAAGVIANPPDVHAALDPSFNDAATP